MKTKLSSTILVTFLITTSILASNLKFTDELIQDIKQHHLNESTTNPEEIQTANLRGNKCSKCLMILKGTLEDAMSDRTKKHMLQNWKSWERPSQTWKIPVRGYIQIARENQYEITDADFIDFSADNFYIDRIGRVSATLNFYGKLPFAKFTGHFDEKYQDKY